MGAKLGDDQTKRLGKLADRIKPQLIADLQPIEAAILEATPLPCTYDVMRMQQPYFHEFTYTELMGGLMLCPQSSIAQAQLIDMALADTATKLLDVAAILETRLAQDGNLDKYNLDRVSQGYDKIAFVPGSNAFRKFVSRERLARLMWEDQDVFLKLHPLSDQNLVRFLKLEFGAHRLLNPQHSGWDYLTHASDVWCCGTTEMGLYAVYLGKPITNIGNFFSEPQAAFSGLYRSLWHADDRRATLLKLLAHPLSGWLHPTDPDVTNRIETYFAAAWSVRQNNRPLFMEITATEYHRICSRDLNPPAPKPKTPKETIPRDQESNHALTEGTANGTRHRIPEDQH